MTIPDPQTAMARVLAMRDDFLLLVAAYNSIHEFQDAVDAQLLAIALDKFEDEHNITDIAWPPREDPENEGCLAEIERAPITYHGLPAEVPMPDVIVDGRAFTLEAKIIHALVTRLGGNVAISGAEMAVTAANGNVMVNTSDNENYQVSAGNAVHHIERGTGAANTENIIADFLETMARDLRKNPHLLLDWRVDLDAYDAVPRTQSLAVVMAKPR